MRSLLKRLGCGVLVIAAVAAIVAAAAVAWYAAFAWSLRPRMTPSHRVSHSEPITEFREFPVYWLGMEYHGLSLTSLNINGPEVTGGAYTEVVLGYGYCKTRGGLDGGSCNPPILIVEQPPCTVRTNLYERSARDLLAWRRDVGVYIQPTDDPSVVTPHIDQIRHDLNLANDTNFSAATLVDTATFRPTLALCPRAPSSTLPPPHS